MPTRHVVQDCESLIQIAERYGFLPHTIWQDPANAELRSRRSDMNVLKAGDVVVIPDPRQRSLFAHTGSRYVVRLRGIPAKYRLQLSREGRPRANEDYELSVDGAPHHGRTDESGVLEEWIPASARRGELAIGPDRERFVIEFGRLDPPDDVVGAKQRLRNLGYPIRDDSSELDDHTGRIIAAFQRSEGLVATGKLDETTARALDRRHGREQTATGSTDPNVDASFPWKPDYRG